MARIESWFDQDLKKPVKVNTLNGNIFSMDNQGNLIGVRVTNNGETASLEGTVSGNVIRSDGATVAVEGTLSGNTAYIVLPQAAYAVPGLVIITIKLTTNDVVTTLAAVTAIVYRSSTDSAVDPGTIIPSIETLIAEIENAIASIPPDYSELTTLVKKGDQIIPETSGELPFSIINNAVVNTSGVIISSENFACITTHIPNNAIIKVDKALDIQGAFFNSSGTFIARGSTKSLTPESNPELYANGSASYILFNVRYPNGSSSPNATDFQKSIHIRVRNTDGVIQDIQKNVDTSGDFVKWERGQINSSGEDQNANTRIRISAATPAKYDLNVIADTGISYVGVYKKYDGTYDVSSTFTGEHLFIKNASTESIRIYAYYTDSREIFNVADMVGSIHLFNIDAYKYRGRVIDNGRTSFVSCIENGYYNFSANDVANLTDKPTTLSSGGILRVERQAATGQIFQTIVDVNGTSYFRYGSNPFSVQNGRAVTWYALGDSITQGYTGSGGEIGPVTTNNYVTNVASLNGFAFTNHGEGGAGYLHNATVGSQKNAKGKVDEIIASDNDFTKCDLVTLAFGVNDWHYNQAIGTVNDDKSLGTTMCSNMKYVIEAILENNPLCKIIVLTPLNCSKYGGDFSTNWGLGYSFSTSGTLQNVVDAIISVCEYYGIEYIDQSKMSICNRYNINDCLGDGIHPFASFYPKMAKDLASKIDMK